MEKMRGRTQTHRHQLPKNWAKNQKMPDKNKHMNLLGRATNMEAHHGNTRRENSSKYKRLKIYKKKVWTKIDSIGTQGHPETTKAPDKTTIKKLYEKNGSKINVG